MTFPCIKVSIFHTFCLITKHGYPTISFIFWKGYTCLILPNTINLEKWQYFNVQNFSLKFHDLPFKSMCFYIIDEMKRSYKIVCMVRYIFFDINVISKLVGLAYENIAKMANKIFNVPNHLKLLHKNNLSRITPLLQSDNNSPSLGVFGRPNIQFWKAIICAGNKPLVLTCLIFIQSTSIPKFFFR